MDDLTPPDRAWMDDAACHGINPELFFVDVGGHYDQAVLDLCASCPVRVDCLNYAIETDSRGYWGGTSDAERKVLIRRMQRKQNRAAKKGVVPETPTQRRRRYIETHRDLIDTEIRRLAPLGLCDADIASELRNVHNLTGIDAEYIRHRRPKIGVKSAWNRERNVNRAFNKGAA